MSALTIVGFIIFFTGMSLTLGAMHIKASYALDYNGLVVHRTIAVVGLALFLVGFGMWFGVWMVGDGFGFGNSTPEQTIEAAPQAILSTQQYNESQQSQQLQQATVQRIIDGDTIDVYMPNGDIERIRLIGIDAPEMGHFSSEEEAEPGAIEARDFVANLLPIGTTVWLEAQGNDRDRWDRLRRYVWVDVPQNLDSDAERQGLTVNRLLLAHGYAEVWP